jgi:hypothetical protein
MAETSGSAATEERSFFISKKIIIPVNIIATPSATGMAAIAPRSPQSVLKRSRQGMRTMHCRRRERMMDIFGLPVTTKKLVDTIWKPTRGSMIVVVCRAMEASCIRVSLPSGAKRRTSCIDMVWVMIKPRVDQMEATTMTLKYALRTRWNFPAP